MSRVFAVSLVLLVAGAQVVVSPAGADAATPLCFGREATIVGTSGDDLLVGTSGSDVIVGLGGDDVIYGGAGKDFICAGGGADWVMGGSARDKIKGQGGADILFGEGGRDTVKGGGGGDLIVGGSGSDDKANGGKGTDECDAEVEKRCEGDPAPWDDDRVDADIDLIERLWDDFSGITGTHVDEVAEFLAVHNHPDSGFGRTYWDACFASFEWQVRTEVVVDRSTVVPSEGFAIEPVGSRIDGLVPRGRLYVYQVDWTAYWPGEPPERASHEWLAAVIGEGSSARAHVFFYCDDD